ncbi:MAG: hypothetical protein EA415_10175 [Sphaerobacteraceae bacterium]|nr:MAG: hypothetical protein EA415_10175 [Sphaerobacteraceae bacterium]
MIRPPKTPPTFTGPRPDTNQSGYVARTDSTMVQAPVEALISWMHSNPLEDWEIDAASVPRIVRTEPLKGTWDPSQSWVGARRRVVLENGHYAAEEIVADSNHQFKYVVWGTTNYASLLIDHAVGEFTFRDLGDQTLVNWTYSFMPRSFLTRLPVVWFVRFIWSGFMTSGLSIMQENGPRIITADVPHDADASLVGNLT